MLNVRYKIIINFLFLRNIIFVRCSITSKLVITVSITIININELAIMLSLDPKHQALNS